jgi:hypothetical protein
MATNIIICFVSMRKVFGNSSNPMRHIKTMVGTTYEVLTVQSNLPTSIRLRAVIWASDKDMCACLSIMLQLCWHINIMEASAINKLPISANNFYCLTAPTTPGDWQTKGFGMAKPLSKSVRIYNGAWICMA